MLTKARLHLLFVDLILVTLYTVPAYMSGGKQALLISMIIGVLIHAYLGWKYAERIYQVLNREEDFDEPEVIGYTLIEQSVMDYLYNLKTLDIIDILNGTFAVDIELNDEDEIVLDGEVISDGYFDEWYADFVDNLPKNSIVALYEEMYGNSNFTVDWEQ